MKLGSGGGAAASLPDDAAIRERFPWGFCGCGRRLDKAPRRQGECLRGKSVAPHALHLCASVFAAAFCFAPRRRHHAKCARASGRGRAAARRLTCDAVSAANSEQWRHMSQIRNLLLFSLLSSIIISVWHAPWISSPRICAGSSQCINIMHHAQLVQGPVEMSRFRQYVSHLRQKLLQRRVGSFPHNAIIPCARKRERISSIKA